MNYTLIPLLMGLSGVVHCVGMCGGIMGMLTAGLPPAVRDAPARRLAYLSLYNLSRIASYVFAGAVAGLLGHHILQWISPQSGHAILQGLSAVFLLGIGLHLAGWLPQLARLEHLGAPLWRRLEPLAQRLLPVNSPVKALLFGALWGWFPCGMVYTAVLYSTTLDGLSHGATFMFFFGLGTLPATFSVGMLSGALARATRHPAWRRAIGVFLILVALLTLAMPGLLSQQGPLPTTIPH